MQTEPTILLNPSQIGEAARLLRAGRLVAFPTETVYGLGAPIFLEEAVKEIFVAKGRPSDNPLIAHISHLDQVHQIAREIPEQFYRLATTFFPGPLTVVLKRHQDVPPLVSAGLDTIALRMPAHSLARELIDLVGVPIVAPSANLSGKPSATESTHVRFDFDGKIAAILDGGKTEYGIESTVVSLLGPKPVILRPGSIARDQIAKVLGEEVLVATEACQGSASSPGMKYKHYAPEARVRFFDRLELMVEATLNTNGKRQLVLSRVNPELGQDYIPLSAAEFYRALRDADAQGYNEILIYCDEKIQGDEGLMNRVRRSAGM